MTILTLPIFLSAAIGVFLLPFTVSRADNGAAFSPLPPPNLLTNGDFEAGNRDFFSGYLWTNNPRTAPGQEGNYTVGTNPQRINGLGASFGDHTTGTGQMLIVNGSTNAEGQVVWRQDVPVTPRRVYRLTFWVASWGRLGDSTAASNPAQIEARVNGGRVNGAPVTAPSVVGQWRRVSSLWSSGEATTVRLTLVDRNHEFIGNDFAIDDMAFQNVDVRR